MTIPTNAIYRMRPVRESDYPWIAKSWVRSYQGTSLAKAYGALYVREYSLLLWSALRQMIVIVACDVEDDDAILGWVAFDDRALHYVHVQEGFRGAGIARALVSGVEPRIYTHRPASRSLVPEDGWTFNPFAFLLRYGHGTNHGRGAEGAGRGDAGPRHCEPQVGEPSDRDAPVPVEEGSGERIAGR